MYNKVKLIKTELLKTWKEKFYLTDFILRWKCSDIRNLPLEKFILLLKKLKQF